MIFLFCEFRMVLVMTHMIRISRLTDGINMELFKFIKKIQW
jgi:hypothetical protein